MKHLAKLLRGTHLSWAHFSGALVLMLSGCAKYSPYPLPPAPDLTAAPALTAPARAFWLPGLAPHPIPSNGLDENTVIMLAVFDDPDLRAARLQAGVAGAQLLEAGLLPDPQLSTGYATSALNYGGAVGLTEDIQALITRGAAEQAAKAYQQQVNLSILWQEWQVAERASQLFVQIYSEGELQQILDRGDRLLAARYRRDQTGMQRGDVTSAEASTDFAAWSDSRVRIHQLAIDLDLARHQLNQLLGVEPNAQLRLLAPGAAEPLSRKEFETALASLAQRRADLLALKAGYESQEETLRRAILAQFPAMNAGVVGARDPVEGVNSIGFNINVTLPIFNRNRGQIAIQRATRALLRETYQAQLDAAGNQADQVWQATQIMEAELKELDSQTPQLRETAAAAEQSFQRGNMDSIVYTGLETQLFAKQGEEIQLRAALANARAALDILLGRPLAFS